MNIIDYKSKYIKYKLKYLDLIKQYAGADPIVVLLCSHQGRLACLINALTGEKLEKNFKNCCIIKLEKKGENISLQIVYEGEFVFECTDKNPSTCAEKEAAEKEKYYPNNIPFLLNEEGIEIIKKLFQDDVIFLMVRHGDGEHLALKRKGVLAKTRQNIADRFKSSDKQILRDAHLTQEGIIQAQNAGNALAELLQDKSIDFIFFSDLERTRQTIAKMLSKINKDKIPDSAKVLHCSHEVGYKKDGSNCDGERILDGIKRGLIIENLPKADKISQFPTMMQITKEKKIDIDISRYSEFYNPNTQTPSKKKVLRHKSSSTNKCKNLTMLQQIAAVVNSPPIV